MFEFIFVLVQVIILDGILSIDNAAALGAIASKLPAHEQAPVPHILKWLGTNQREVSLKVGILGAYFGRGLMLLIAGFIIQLPILKVVGAGYLLYLVIKYFYDLYIENQGGDEESGFVKKAGIGFWHTVILIELADLAFSVDNVLAVVAISSNILFVIIGVFISIVIMRFAAQIFIKLIEIEPLLQHAAYVLIFAIAIELLLKFFGVHIDELLQFGVSIGILVLFTTLGRVRIFLNTER